MNEPVRVMVVGQVLVDVTLPAAGEQYKLRAGGIVHAARALWAMGSRYSLAYMAPKYLEREVLENAANYGAAHAAHVGTVSGCPNVILIAEAKEVGSQGYQLLLRDHQRCDLDLAAVQSLTERCDPTDVLAFPGGFPLGPVLRTLASCKARVHVDAGFAPESPEEFGELGRPFETIIYSTSSQIFAGRYQGEFPRLCGDLLGRYSNSVLLKENRGGTRFQASGEAPVHTPAYPSRIQHSVGVGDCFDAVFIALRQHRGPRAALAYASCAAAEYASTTYPEVFKGKVESWLGVPADEIVTMEGTRLPWEARPAFHVYVAGPDFDGVDRRPIDAVADSLRYHNFTPRLPVRENGEAAPGAGRVVRETLCSADMAMLDSCRIMVAVLLYNDPGTLIEIGVAVERGMPVIVYDPYRLAKNLILTQLPDLVTDDPDEVITKVFVAASRMHNR